VSVEHVHHNQGVAVFCRAPTREECNRVARIDFGGGESLNHTRLNLELNEEQRRVPSHQCAQAVVIPDMLRVLYSKTLSSKLADIHSR